MSATLAIDPSKEISTSTTAFDTFKEVIYSAWEKCCKVAISIFQAIADVRNNVSAFIKGNKIIANILMGIGAFFPNATGLTKGAAIFTTAVDTIDPIATLGEDLNTLTSDQKVRDTSQPANADGKHPAVLDADGKEVRSTGFMSAIANDPLEAVFISSLIVANIGGIILWLHDLAVYNLDVVTTALSNAIPGFAAVAKIGLGAIVNGLVAFAFVAKGISSVINLVRADTTEKKIHAALTLAWSVAEVALKVFCIVGGAALFAGPWGFVALAAFGIAAAALGIAATLYKNYVVDALPVPAPKTAVAN